jgi:hypothetical protein
MAITKKPQRNQDETAKPDPLAFIQGAHHAQPNAEAVPEAEPGKRKRKEPVIIRFDENTLELIDRAATKRGLSRAALVRMLVIENLPD